MGGTLHVISPTLKSGGHLRRVPHQIAPMYVQHGLCSCSLPVKYVVFSWQFLLLGDIAIDARGQTMPSWQTVSPCSGASHYMRRGSQRQTFPMVWKPSQASFGRTARGEQTDPKLSLLLRGCCERYFLKDGKCKIFSLKLLPKQDDERLDKFPPECIVLRPSNSSGRVSRIPHALISAVPASRRKLLVAARRVVLSFRNVMRVVVQSNFFWLVILRCFWSNPVHQRNLFVTAWSWYGHFYKSLFYLNLWLVIYRLAVLYRHLSTIVSPQGNTTAFLN